MSTLRCDTLESFDGTFSIQVKNIPTAPGPGGQLSAGNNLSDLQDRAQGMANLRYVSVGTGAASRSARDKANDTVSVRDFGAVGDNTADDTAAIQAALDSGAGYVMFPHDTTSRNYRITSALVCNTSKQTIDGNGCSVTLDDASGLKSIFQIGNGTTVRDTITLTNFIIGRTQSSTAGAGVDMRLVGASYVRNVGIAGQNKVFRGISLTSCSEIWLDACSIDSVRDRGIYCIGTAPSPCGDVKILDCLIEGGASDGIYCDDYVIGIYCFRSIIFNNAGWGAKCNPTVPSVNLSYRFQQCDFDTCLGGGVFLERTTNVQINDCWISNATGVSLQVKSTSSTIVFNGNQVYTNGSYDACDIAGANVIISNNLLGSGNRLVYCRATAQQVVAIGNYMGNSGAAAVDLSAGPTQVSIIGNVYVGNVSNFNAGGTAIINTGNSPSISTGWGAATGTATRTTFVTGSVTTAALAEHVKALIDDLLTQGVLHS